MTEATPKSHAQEEGEASIDAFRQDLGPFVVAAEKTRMPMVFVDEEPGHPVIFANDAFLKLTGYVREEVLAKSFQSLLAVGADPEGMPLVEAAFRGACEHEPEIHYRRKDGSEFWASVFVSPVCDEGGTVVQQFVSFIDLTRHRQESARSRMLIDELNHRVKNTLSTVQSIVTQALRRPAEPAAIREAIESRIMALSRSHDLLTSGNWEGAGLHDLVDTALRPFQVVAGRTERFTIVGDNVHLAPNATLSIAIALHELATNAVKYGAFSNDAGTIAIDWTVSQAAGGERLELRWRERDGPPVTPPTHKGFGSWVIERGLHWHQQAEWAVVTDGRCRITVLDAEGRPAIREVGQGDLWYFPPGLPHSLQGLGTTGAEFVLVFDNGRASEFNTLLLNEWMAHTPPDVLAANFDLPVSAFRNLPVDDTWIFQGPPPMPLADAQAAVRTPLGEPEDQFTFSMNDMRPDKVTRGGEVKIIDTRNFPVSKTIAAALVTVRPGGMRELHWHPNADEWQYYIKGQARMTVFNTGPKAQTADFKPGDIGVVKKSLGHYVQNTGTTDLMFMEIFKDSRYQEVSLSQWLAATPPDLLASHLNMDPKLLQKFRTPRVVVPS